MVGHNAWIVAEGPMEGKGYTRFTDIREVDELIHPFTLEAIEVLSRTVGNGAHRIKELLIFGEKNSSQ